VNSRLRVARNNLAAANDKYQALLLGPSAKRLLELIGNPTPVPHGSEVRQLAAQRWLPMPGWETGRQGARSFCKVAAGADRQPAPFAAQERGKRAQALLVRQVCV
jgi:hypothetical protein